LYTDYSKLLYQTGQLRALGGVLFTDYILSIILISVLLFISMFGSIVMTLETHAYKIIKEQDSNIQGLRHPNMTSLSYRFDLQDKKVILDAKKEKDYGLFMGC
jgi:hypothetical protein